MPLLQCIGDCNEDGAVTVDEIIVGVNIALGNTPVSECLGLDSNDDGSVTVNEIIAAVNAVLNGCPTQPSPTPVTEITPTSVPASPTQTSVPASPTPTPTPIGLLFSGVVSDLVPHAVNDQLVYRVTDPLGVVTTETTTAISSDPGGPFVIDDLELDSHGKTIKHELQSYTDKGNQLLFTGLTDETTDLTIVTTCDPQLLRMVMPLIAGQRFATTNVTCNLYLSDGTFIGFVTRTDTFTPVEIVDSLEVPAGTFHQVIHINGSTDVTGTGLETDEIYFVAGVGPILDVATLGGQTTRTELVSGTIGGVPVAP